MGKPNRISLSTSCISMTLRLVKIARRGDCTSLVNVEGALIFSSILDILCDDSFPPRSSGLTVFSPKPFSRRKFM